MSLLRNIVILCLLLLAALPAQATITTSSSNCASAAVNNQNPTIASPNAVSAGATIVVGIFNRTNNTEAISSVSDATNGAYSTDANLVSTIGGGSTGRGHLYYFLNSASTTPTVTVAWATQAINTQLVICWFSSDLGAMTFDSAASPATFASATTVTSNAITAGGDGGLIGLIVSNNTQTGPTTLGTGEIELITATRAILLYEPTVAGSESFEGSAPGITILSANGVFLAAGFLEGGGGGGGTIVNPISGRGGAAAQPVIH